MPCPGRHLLAHLGDHAVAVEVVEAVLVDPAVAVVVDRHHHGAREVRRGRAGEPAHPAVGIDHRHDVEHRPVEQLGDARQAAVVPEHEIDRVESGVRPLHLVGVGVAVDVEGRLFELRAGRRVVQGEHPEVPSLAALAQAVELHPARVGGLVAAQQLDDLLVGVDPVEARLGSPGRGLQGLRSMRNSGDQEEGRHRGRDQAAQVHRQVHRASLPGVRVRERAAVPACSEKASTVIRVPWGARTSHSAARVPPGSRRSVT